MPISVDFHLINRQLIRPFKTARSEVSKKDVLILIFNNEFAFELPLSPSMGEMPDETISMAKKGIASPMVLRSLGFYKGMNSNNQNISKVSPLKKFHTITYDINNKEYHEGNYLQRFKGSAHNMNEIAEWSHKNKDQWTIDFNAGLSKEELESFIEMADLSNCLFIEQPLLPGASSLPEAPVDYWADEELKELAPNKFLESNFRGFMLKPLAFDFQEFCDWITFANKSEIPFFISGLACDNLFFSFLKYWNSFSTWQNVYPESSNFFTEQLSLVQNPYETNNFKDVIEQTRADFEKVCSLELND